MKESAKRIAQEWEKREKESVKEEKLEEVCTTANTTDGPVVHQLPKSFDWAEDVGAGPEPVWKGSDVQKAAKARQDGLQTGQNRTTYLGKRPNNTKQPQQPLSSQSPYHNVSATITPIPVTLVAPAAHAPCDFSTLRLKN